MATDLSIAPKGVSRYDTKLYLIVKPQFGALDRVEYPFIAIIPMLTSLEW